MGKSLTAAAKSILMKEGQIPSVSASDNNPDRDVKNSTSNMQTLHPKTKFAEPDPKHDESEDLGGATPTSTAKENLGAKASKSKDTSKSSKSSVASEPMKKLVAEKKESKEDDEDDEDDINESITEEEFDAYIDSLIDEGYSENEIADIVSEQFDVSDLSLDEETEELEEDEEFELSEELESFITDKLEEGLSEEEIVDAIAEEFELAEESLDEQDKALFPSRKEYGAYTKRILGAFKGAAKDLGSEVKDGARVRKQQILSRLKKESFEVKLDEAFDALFDGEDLSEDFKTKAKTIFEAVVNSRVADEVEALDEAYTSTIEDHIIELSESVEEAYANEITEINENVKNYLSYVTEQWLNENEVAIESGIKTELTEDFISGLRNLFAEHYIDIPESAVDVVEELGNEVSELKNKLNEEIERNVALSQELNESKKFEIVVEAMQDLSSTQAEKFQTLVEGLTYTNPEEFAEKVQTLKESYFSGVKVPATNKPLDTADSADKGLITENLSGRMETYVNVIGKKLPK